MEYLYPKFRYAAKGIKNILVAEIVFLVASILSLGISVYAILTTLGSSSDSQPENLTEFIDSVSAEPDNPIQWGIIILTVIALVMMITGYLMKIVGVRKAILDERIFIVPFITIFAGIFLAVLSEALPDDWRLSTVSNVLSRLINDFITFMIIIGCQRLLYNMGESRLAKLGTVNLVLLIIVAVLIVVSYLPFWDDVNIYSLILKGTPYVLSGAQYVIYFIYLVKTKKTLNYEY